jgi:hypothetical protein
MKETIRRTKHYEFTAEEFIEIMNFKGKLVLVDFIAGIVCIEVEDTTN